MITPGTYTAKIISHAITETKNGDPQATITFSFSTEGKTQTLNWYGSFKERAAPYTIKTLLTCGLRGNNPAGELEIGKEVQIVVDDEENQDGKTFSRIKFVNPLGGVKKVIETSAAKARLAALEGAVMAARQESGQNQNTTDEEMPEWLRD